MYTVTSIGDWVVGLLKLSLIESDVGFLVCFWDILVASICQRRSAQTRWQHNAPSFGGARVLLGTKGVACGACG